ncbi:MAG: 50S ribosomal protein L10 [Bacteroidales bacterium]|nr:50S ribosomal protein L10 [Bacteroidales bacterium]
MTREEKNQVIGILTDKINNASHIYVTNSLGLNAGDTVKLRKECYKNEIELVIAKNTLLKKAIEKSDKDLSELFEALAGPTSIMFSEVGNKPAKLIKDFKKKFNLDKPLLKGAYVEEGFYFGDDQIDVLASIKSKEELIADVIGLLQAPAVNVLSALQSGGNTLTGILKTLEEKE